MHRDAYAAVMASLEGMAWRYPMRTFQAIHAR